jgi:hypothetical protein
MTFSLACRALDRSAPSHGRCAQSPPKSEHGPRTIRDQRLTLHLSQVARSVATADGGGPGDPPDSTIRRTGFDSDAASTS